MGTVELASLQSLENESGLRNCAIESTDAISLFPALEARVDNIVSMLMEYEKMTMGL
jgi:hypothetical protein